MTGNPLIIVIDDDAEVREVICEAIRRLSYNVLWAENGALGIDLLHQHPQARLIVTDIIMPDKEGIETIMEIKRDFPHIKLIAISGSGHGMGMDFLDIASKLGADAALPKPVDFDLLEETLATLLS